MNTKVLILGGAGYIGLAITEKLLQDGYEVTVLDNLLYDNFFALKNFLPHKNFKFEKFDFTKENLTSVKDLDSFDHAIILAGLVGDPITKKYPNYSSIVNGKNLRKVFFDFNGTNIKKLIFTSTCSNYGLIKKNEKAKEEHELNPLSLYAKEKVSAERYIEKNAKDFSFQSVILRFSTAFGCAPRMRFDLSINEFVRDIYMGKLLEVYDSETWRPYCHTKDFGELIKKILESDREYFGEIFNAGSDENNATKKMIVENIIKYIPKAKVKFVEGGFDKRNYKVDFTKVKEHFNFSPKWSIDKGIKEIVEKLKEGEFLSESENKNFYGNYFIRGKD